MSISQLSLLLDKSIVSDQAKFYSEEAYQKAIEAFMGIIPINNVLISIILQVNWLYLI